MRQMLAERDFVEIETPILTRSTPEGARDFLVPSRLQPGSWYALPQSPQLFKQLLMMSGYERYYQIARCFRDEDLRADRQPEFTQLDLEMGFVEEDDVLEVTEAVMHAVFQATGFPLPPPPWPRLTYHEAMVRFGSDRPDRRFGLELSDVSDTLRGSEFRVFESVLGGGGAVRALNAGAREMSRSELDGLNDVVRRHGGKAVAYAFVENGAWRSPIAKFFSAEQQAAVIEALGGSEGDLLLFVADEPRTAAEALGALRLELGRRFGLIPEGTHDVLWVVDFPMFEPRRGRALGRGAPPVHGAEGLVRGPRSDALARLRPRRRRLGARRRVDPYQHARGPARGLQGHRPGGGGGRPALRLPARRAEVRRPAARRHRDGDRPRRGPDRRRASRSARSSRSRRPRAAATR